MSDPLPTSVTNAINQLDNINSMEQRLKGKSLSNTKSQFPQNG